MSVSFLIKFLSTVSTLKVFALSAEDIRPQNVVVVAGHGMTLTCKIYNAGNMLNPVAWYFNGNDQRGELVIFNGRQIHGNFTRFQFNNRTFDLWTNSTEMKDAGQYKCITKTAVHSAYVIILSAQPECTSEPSTSPSNGPESVTLKGLEDFQMWCKVQMRFDWVPSMRCSTFDGRHMTVNDTINRVGNSGLALLTSLVIFDPSSDSILFTTSSNPTTEKRFRFNCTISFDRSNLDNRMNISARNNPDYRYDWSSPEIIYRPTPKTTTTTTTTAAAAAATTTTRNNSVTNGTPDVQMAEFQAGDIPDKAGVEEEGKQFVLTIALILSGVLVTFAILVIIVGVVVVLVYRRRKRAKVEDHSPNQSVYITTVQRRALPHPNIPIRESCISTGNIYQDLDEHQMFPIHPPYDRPSCILEQVSPTHVNDINDPVYHSNGSRDTYLVPEDRGD